MQMQDRNSQLGNIFNKHLVQGISNNALAGRNLFNDLLHSSVRKITGLKKKNKHNHYTKI